MPRSAATKKTAPKILTREIVLALRWNICGIGRTASGARREGDSRRGRGPVGETSVSLLRFGRRVRGYCVKTFTYWMGPWIYPCPRALSQEHKSGPIDSDRTIPARRWPWQADAG